MESLNEYFEREADEGRRDKRIEDTQRFARAPDATAIEEMIAANTQKLRDLSDEFDRFYRRINLRLSEVEHELNITTNND
jgi:hypothetical protein